MSRVFFDRENALNDEDEKSRRVEERIKERWLLIVGIVGFLMPGVCPPIALFWSSNQGMFLVHIFFGNWPYPQLFMPGMPLSDWLKAGRIYMELSAGTTLSAVLLWQRMARNVRYPDWKSGMRAGMLANLLAYSLTVVVIIVIKAQEASNPMQPGLERIGTLLLNTAAGALFGLIGLVMYGLFTTPVALVLGALCGWLEGRELRNMKRKILKY